MQEEINKKSVISSLIWKFLERGGTQGIQFVVSLIIARLLLPADYGILAVISVFIVIANVFVQGGFNTALIQKKDSDEVDFSSVFYLSLFFAALIYVILFFSAPFISKFYDNELYTPILRVLSLTLFFGSFNSIQNAYIAKHMIFKKLFFSSIGAVVVSGALGIIFALKGLGVWALVVQQLSSQISITFILWFTVKWRPRLLFSWNKLKVLFSFGWKLLVSNLINNLYLEVRSLIIGKKYTSEMLGYYNRGQQFPNIIVSNLDGSIQSVMLPTLSAHQNNLTKIKEIVRKSIMTSAYIIFPMMMGMAVIAEPMVRLILTEKWLPAVPYIRIFCLSYAVWPIHTANLQAINALGRSDIFLVLEIIKKVAGIIILIASIPLGVLSIAWGTVFNGLLSSFINAYPNKKLFNYSYLEQLKDLFPSMILSLVMGLIVYNIQFIPFKADIVILFFQTISGFGIYIGLSALIKIESYSYLKKTIMQILKSEKLKNLKED